MPGQHGTARKRGRAPLVPTREIQRLLGKLTDAEVARRAGVSTTTVLRWRRARDLRPTTGRTPEAEQQLRERLRQLRERPGVNLEQAAEQLHITLYVASELSRTADPPIEWPRTGRPPNQRTAARARHALRLRCRKRGGPAPYSEIARRLKCSRGEAHRLVTIGERQGNGST